MTDAPRVEDLVRQLAPQVLGALVRRHGDFGRCEDALQEALVAAHASWRSDGLPDFPGAWLTTVATRRLVDAIRADAARERRELVLSQQVRLFAPPPDEAPPERDDSLALLFLCCHPALSPAAQLALTLRAVAGLTTAEIARGLLLAETTVAQRITRAKASIRAAGARFALPDAAELLARLDVVHQVLYLMFTEGHTASSGAAVARPELCSEALRLARLLHQRLPSSSETAGLLALMLLVDSRRATRQTSDGALIPLAEQDRTRWDRDAIAEGATLTACALRTGPVGPYQLHAAIAALHAEVQTSADTDWAEVVGLYDVLERLAPNPVAALNRAVAVATRDGPAAGWPSWTAWPQARSPAITVSTRCGPICWNRRRTSRPRPTGLLPRKAGNSAERGYLAFRAQRLELTADD
ncbi:MAG: sigma-70 family RNA polymerase sigma factor [Actinomycetota bacterium]|nr:sigma-70 family RNA polymerase sigma factor [Actinomycetota bacterium]